MAAHSVSVIVSSYNQPNALRLTLEGFRVQTDLDFEMIIGDDGSDSDTIELIESFRGRAPFPVKLVALEHTVFGKPRVLNSAVRQAKGDQFIFCDGDCVPFRNFVAMHRAHYQPMSFCTAGYVRMRLPAAKALAVEDVAAGRHEAHLSGRRKRQLSWIHAKNLFYMAIGKRFEPKIQGGNFSVARDAFEAVNGFDEAYVGFSKSDSDLRNRLRNIGCRGISLWNKAYVCHLAHEIDPRRCKPEVLRAEPAKEFHKEMRRRTRAEKGLNMLSAQPASDPGTGTSS